MTSLPIIITGQHHNKHNLSVTIKINDNILSSVNNQGNSKFNFEYNEKVIVRHEFDLVITGKTELLNSVNDDSMIKNQVIDSAYIINNIQFDNYDVIPILMTSSKYYHTQNNNVEDCIVEDYTNWLGYDGVLKFTFVTPLFAWFLSDFEY